METHLKSLFEELTGNRKRLITEQDINKATYNNRLLLYEGLIQSCEPEKLIQILNDNGYEECTIGNKQGLSDAEPYNIVILYLSNHKECEPRLLLQILQVCGWQISNIRYQTTNKIKLILSRKFGSDADRIVYKESNGTIYHLTQNRYLRKILSNGIIPKTQNKNEEHKERIYFLTNKSAAMNLLTDMLSYYKWTTYELKTNLMVINLLKIDLNSLDKEKSVFPKFFIDPMAQHSVYTHNNISPYLIKVIETYIVRRLDNNNYVVFDENKDVIFATFFADSAEINRLREF